MPVVDSLGEEFLHYVKDGMKITVKSQRHRRGRITALPGTSQRTAANLPFAAVLFITAMLFIPPADQWHRNALSPFYK